MYTTATTAMQRLACLRPQRDLTKSGFPWPRQSLMWWRKRPESLPKELYRTRYTSPTEAPASDESLDTVEMMLVFVSYSTTSVMRSSTNLPSQKPNIEDGPEPLVVSSHKVKIGLKGHYTSIGQGGFVKVIESKYETPA